MSGMRRNSVIMRSSIFCQVNDVLEPLQEKLGKQFRQELPLLEETDKPSYSDVALVLRNYLDLCTFYMKKRYGTTCHEKRR